MSQSAHPLLFCVVACTFSACGGGASSSPDTLLVDGPIVGDLAVSEVSSLDSDSDGLPDDFETRFGLDPQLSDTDGDGVLDGDEDEDGDGLTTLQEWAAGQLDALASAPPSPLHKDVLIELDYQVDRKPSDAVLREVRAAYAAIPVDNPDGVPGVALHFIVDEVDLPAEDIPESGPQKVAYIGAHPLQRDLDLPLVHILFTAAYPASPTRGGETLGSAALPSQQTGVLIYVDNIEATYPTCATETQPAITIEEGMISTIVHELGHTLQLGHDTDLNGGINYYNIMAPRMPSCDDLQQRTRGIGNSDPDLGATEAVGRPRFSRDAATLMRLDNKISADTSAFEQQDGYEM